MLAEEKCGKVNWLARHYLNSVDWTVKLQSNQPLRPVYWKAIHFKVFDIMLFSSKAWFNLEKNYGWYCDLGTSYTPYPGHVQRVTKKPLYHMWVSRPWWHRLMLIILVSKRMWVGPSPVLQHSFMEIWSWNIFYGHSLPSADSRRAVISFWQKNVHITG